MIPNQGRKQHNGKHTEIKQNHKTKVGKPLQEGDGRYKHQPQHEKRQRPGVQSESSDSYGCYQWIADPVAIAGGLKQNAGSDLLHAMQNCFQRFWH